MKTTVLLQQIYYGQGKLMWGTCLFPPDQCIVKCNGHHVYQPDAVTSMESIKRWTVVVIVDLVRRKSRLWFTRCCSGITNTWRAKWQTVTSSAPPYRWRSERHVWYCRLLTTSSMEMKVFCDVAPCSLVGADRRFRGAYSLHLQGDDGGSRHLWNVGTLQRGYTALCPIRLSYSNCMQQHKVARSHEVYTVRNRLPYPARASVWLL
jgi:hypothetical protein